MQDCLIIGAGSTVKHYQGKIEKFIKKDNMITIGVNNVGDMFDLDHHMWTNIKRYEKYRSCIQENSVLLIADDMIKEVRKDHPHSWSNFIVPIGNDINKWRTAGLRAIQFAHDNATRNIYCVGFDGYSLVYGGDQHCYGSGMSDLNDMKKSKGHEYEVEKDDLVYSQMRRMEKEGVMFEILTPTIFSDYYVDNIL